jgi:xylan 1,4-beta-xylosidase
MKVSPLISAVTAAATVACRPSPTEARRDAAHLITYRNPVLPGFHPDPSIVRVGEWFYLVNSSFALFPGVPIYRSLDVVHWEPLGHVLDRDSQLPLADAESWAGIWAPTIRYHAGTYYVITTNMPHRGSFFVTAKDPRGPWSEPVWIPGLDGIDPSLFFDDDGKVYLTSTGTPPGIYAAQIDVESGELLTGPRLVWTGTGGRYPEGPHLYKIAGHYYLMISEGGTEYGHMVTMARASSPWGPFEPCPRNPILTHRNTTNGEPIQGTGHADLVEDGEGNWWMVLLAFRPQGGYWHHLGRETFLSPVRWDTQGWPVVNEGKPISLEMEASGVPPRFTPTSPVRNDFDGPLGPAWNYLRNPVRASYSLTERPGWLTLHGTATPLDADQGVSPTFVGRRQEHLSVRMAARIDFSPRHEGEEAGLVLYRAPRFRYELGLRVGREGREVFVRQTVGTYISTVTGYAVAPGAEPLVLQIDAEPTRYTFGWGSSPDRLHPIGGAETRLLSTEVAGGFIGTYVGMYARALPDDSSPAPAAFDWFDYEPRE